MAYESTDTNPGPTSHPNWTERRQTAEMQRTVVGEMNGLFL